MVKKENLIHHVLTMYHVAVLDFKTIINNQ